MIFRVDTLLLSLLSLQFASPFASAIEVSMIDMKDVLENQHILTDSSDPYGATPYKEIGARGVSLIKSELKKLLLKTANAEIGEMDPSEWHEVQTTYLNATSDFHQDHNQEDLTLVEDEVGFVALNTNEDAYFDHLDMKVPIREGAFVRFKGSDPHRTVVNKGSVHLLGPFDLKSFAKVGNSVILEEEYTISGFCCGEGGCVEASVEECYSNEGLAFIYGDIEICQQLCRPPTTSAPCECEEETEVELEVVTEVGKAGKGGKGSKATLTPNPVRRQRRLH